jgi:murein tripeptide amidase MpaA
MYLNVDEIETALVNLADEYPSLCQLITLPNKTVENRTSHALRLGGGAVGSREVAIIIGGQHAREWGSSDICVNFCADLLEAYDGGLGLAYGGKTYTAAQIQTLLDTLHIVVFPDVNPDGRAFSLAHDHEEESGGWRRNRNPAMSGGDPACVGVDLNRNFDVVFDLSKFADVDAVTSHTSNDPCHFQQIYHGPSAFSEAETKNVKWLIDTHPRTRWFFDVHSYARDILYSWGDDESQSTDPAMNFRNPAFDGLRELTATPHTRSSFRRATSRSRNRWRRVSTIHCSRCAARTTPSSRPSTSIRRPAPAPTTPIRAISSIPARARSSASWSNGAPSSARSSPRWRRSSRT